MKTMTAVRYLGPRQEMRTEMIPHPGDPGPGEALVRIEAAGVCHTELHFLRGILDLGVHPLTLGHEIAGTVERIGPGVHAVREGDRVLAYYYLGCGTCEYCLAGEENLCPQPRRVHGFSHDGGFAEYIRTAARNLIPLPDSIPFEQAAPIGCSVSTGVHAIARAGLRVDEWVVVLGIGGVGFGLVQLAARAGARVIAVGRNPRKLEMARRLGAEIAIDATRGKVVEAIRDHTRGHGADVVFELVGSSDTLPLLLPSLAKHGRIVFIGYTEASMDLSPLGLVLLEGNVTGSVGNTLAELRHAVSLVGERKVQVIVDRVEPLGRLNQVLHDLGEGTIVGRAVVRP